MIKLTKRKRKWQKVLITVLPIVAALIFVGVLILQSEILRPGGLWIDKPKGNVITDNHLTLKMSAYSYTVFPLDRIEVHYWFEGINLYVWKKLCVLQPREDRTYTCDFNFMTLNAPVGKKILISFEAYGVLMREPTVGNLLANYRIAPDGWGCFYWQEQDVANPCGRGYP